MLENLVGRLPANMIIICALSAFLLPFIIKKVNEKLLTIINPPWKKGEP